MSTTLHASIPFTLNCRFIDMTVKLKVAVLTLLTTFTPAAGILNQETLVTIPNDAQKDSFKEWKTTFRKSYKSAQEEQQAMRNVIRNKKEVEIHNIRYKAGMETYSRGLWEMSDLSFEETTNVLAGSTFNFSALNLQGTTSKLEDAPSEINWVKAGRVHPVDNQEKCGSCFAFAAVATAEGVLLKKGINTRLSVQQIVDCDKLNDGCDGGDPLLAFRYIKSNGISSSERYPYTAKRGKCKPSSDTTISIASATRERLKGNEGRLKKIVATYGPVSVAINAVNSFTNYRSGIYTNPKCSKNLNHALLLVGYGYDSKTKLDYWLVKNSWGTSWGESGYVRMARNKGSICGIASEVIYAT